MKPVNSCHSRLARGSRATNNVTGLVPGSPRKAGMTVLGILLASCLLSSCSYMPSWMGGREEEKPKLPGERKIALPVENQLRADPALKSSASIPAVSANADWEKSSGLSGNLAGGKFENKMSADAGKGNNFSHSLIPAPVVSGGVVYAMDAAGIISAHDAADISNVRWKSKVVADEDEHEVIGGGLTISSGVLYAVTGQGAVAAINIADGEQLWKKNFGVPMRGTPRIAGDRVVVGTIDNQTYGLSAKTGDILWDHRGINETAAVMNSVSPTIVGADILIPYSSGELFALSMADGKELWSETFSQNQRTQAYSIFSGIGADPVVEGPIAYITSTNGITSALDMIKGKRNWQQQAASLNTPWLAGSELFMLTTGNTLVDFVKNMGQIRWMLSLDSYEDMEKKVRPISWRGPVLVDSKLVVVGSSGQMVFVSTATGKIIETRSIPDNIMTAPVVAGGRLYLVGQDATLYSFQ